ncbi:hypothetical protein ABLO27_23790 [Roseibium sp. SCPC15]|uniref:hypothetical protein n=1 Tax=Roseibium sp. SCP15 TaxID=3141376 RepID=UPI003336686D
MMIEPRSTATIRALASLAELSANQLEEGVSVEEVIATLRKAAEAVKSVVEAEEEAEWAAEEEAADLAQDLTPMDLSESEDEDDVETENDQPVLNAG